MRDDCLPRRIHSIGGPASGKTTLARVLAGRLRVPVCHLDQIAWENGDGVSKRPLAARLADLDQILAQPAWVTEGYFLWWVDELLAAADAVIWLDPPLWRVLPRLIVREIHQDWRGRGQHSLGGRLINLKHLAGFLLWTLRYYCSPRPALPQAPDDDLAVRRVSTAARLASLGDRLLHGHDRSRIVALLAGSESLPAAAPQADDQDRRCEEFLPLESRI